jgi:hypothetical protein
MRLTLLFMAFLTILAAAACAGGDRSRGYTVADSAGIIIVQNHQAQVEQTQLWTLSADPAVEIPLGPEMTPSPPWVTGMASLPGNRLAVLNQNAHQVLLISHEGERLARFGHEGDGHGEFRELASVIPMPEDSVGVYDSAARTLSVFDGRGRLGRSVSLAEVVQGRFDSFLLPLPNGDMVFFAVSGPGAGFREGVFRVSRESLRIGPAGEVRASYGSFPGTEVFGGFDGAGRALFGTTTYAATVGHLLAVGTGEATEITLFDTTGSPERIVRWPDHDRTITPRHEEDLFAAALEAQPGVPRATMRGILDGAPRASLLPPYEGLLGTDDGHVWVGAYQGPRYSLRGQRPPGREWLVFDTLGVLTARVETPEGFQPHEVAGSKVWGTFENDDGARSVRAHTLQHTGG